MILHHQRALQSAPGALARGQSVGVTFDQGVIIAAAVEDESEAPHHDLGAKAAVKATRKADHIAVAVYGSDVASVALMIANAASRDITRALEARAGITGTKFDRSLGVIDQLAALGSIFFREQP